MRKFIKTLVLAVMVGVSFTSCKKDNVEPEVVTPAAPKKEVQIQTAFRLKVYYTKLNLIDTSYIRLVGGGHEIETDTKVVPKGDISLSNYKEGKYDLVDSTGYYPYYSSIRFNHHFRSWGIANSDVFYPLYKEGYIHKVVVEMSNISKIDYSPNRVGIVTKSIFLREFEKLTYGRFKHHYLTPIYTNFRTQKSIYYIEDLVGETVDPSVYIEFKDVPYYK